MERGGAGLGGAVARATAAHCAQWSVRGQVLPAVLLCWGQRSGVHMKFTPTTKLKLSRFGSVGACARQQPGVQPEWRLLLQWRERPA